MWQTVTASLILDVSLLGDVSKRFELYKCWIIETCHLLQIYVVAIDSLCLDDAERLF